MKILKIENNIGKFTTDGQNYKNINELTKSDIFQILVLILETEEDNIELDSITDEKIILNDAQKIIYEKIHDKLVATKSKRIEILNSVNQEINPILEKYNITLDD